MNKPHIERKPKLEGSFSDPVELEDNIDINDPRAKFYLVDVSNQDGTNPGFKFCGTVQDLSRLQFDPESRKKHYWPVTVEQLEKANMDVLFPQKKMRREIFREAQDVQDVFRFDSPFNPLTTVRLVFGENAQYRDIYRGYRAQATLSRLQEYSAPINRNVRNLIELGFITEQEYTTINEQERMNIKFTHRLIANRFLTIEAAKQLTDTQFKILAIARITTLIEEGKLSVDEAKALTYEQGNQLFSLQPLISQGTLTVQSALQLQLDDRQRSMLNNNSELILLIQQGVITVNEVINLSDEDAYKCSQTQPFIFNHLLTFDEAKTLTLRELWKLIKPVVYNLILNQQLTVNQGKHLTDEEVSSLEAGRVEEVLRRLPPDATETPGSRF